MVYLLNLWSSLGGVFAYPRTGRTGGAPVWSVPYVAYRAGVCLSTVGVMVRAPNANSVRVGGPA